MKNGLKKFMLITMAIIISAGVSACGEKDAADKPIETQKVVSEEKKDKAKESETPEKDDGKEKEKEATAAPTQTTKVTQQPKKEAATKKPAQPTAAAKTQTPAPAQKATPTPTPAPTPTPTPTPQPTKSAPVATADKAAAYIGSSTASLVAAIGQPNSKSYASSCIGDGQDGEWYYNGFTVYTYKDVDGSETVQDVF